jgi:hypothetical protein
MPEIRQSGYRPLDLLFALAALLIIFAGPIVTFLRQADYIIPALALLCPIHLLWSAQRLYAGVEHLAEKPQREQLALTGILAEEFLKNRFLAQIRQSLRWFLLSTIPLVLSLALYSFTIYPGKSAQDRLQYFGFFVPSYYAIALIGFLMLVSGLLRTLRNRCRAANTQRANAVRGSAIPAFSIAAALIVPWALGLGALNLFGGLAVIAPLLIVLAYSLADVADSYKSLCKIYYQFE